VTYRVEFTEEADKDLEDISDTRIRTTIIKRAYGLQDEPEKQGKPLTDDLKGLYSVRAAGQRYRIVYRIRVTELKPLNKSTQPRQASKGKQEDSSPLVDRVVTVMVVGIRKEGSKSDVYNVARKRLGKK
jgi:mRNA interferase RelE/StbE